MQIRAKKTSVFNHRIFLLNTLYFIVLLGKLVDRIVHHIATVKTMLKLFLKKSGQQKGKVTINQIKGQSHLWKEIKCLLAEHV